MDEPDEDVGYNELDPQGFPDRESWEAHRQYLIRRRALYLDPSDRGPEAERLTRCQLCREVVFIGASDPLKRYIAGLGGWGGTPIAVYVGSWRNLWRETWYHQSCCGVDTDRTDRSGHWVIFGGGKIATTEQERRLARIELLADEQLRALDLISICLAAYIAFQVVVVWAGPFLFTLAEQAFYWMLALLS